MRPSNREVRNTGYLLASEVLANHLEGLRRLETLPEALQDEALDHAKVLKSYYKGPMIIG